MKSVAEVEAVLKEHGLETTWREGDAYYWSNGSFNVVLDFYGNRWRFQQHGAFGPAMTGDEMAEFFNSIDRETAEGAGRR